MLLKVALTRLLVKEAPRGGAGRCRSRYTPAPCGNRYPSLDPSMPDPDVLTLREVAALLRLDAESAVAEAL